MTRFTLIHYGDSKCDVRRTRGSLLICRQMWIVLLNLYFSVLQLITPILWFWREVREILVRVYFSNFMTRFSLIYWKNYLSSVVGIPFIFIINGRLFIFITSAYLWISRKTTKNNNQIIIANQPIIPLSDRSITGRSRKQVAIWASRSSLGQRPHIAHSREDHHLCSRR